MDTPGSDFQFASNPSREQLIHYVRVFGLIGSMKGCHDDVDVIQAAIGDVVQETHRDVALRVLARALAGDASHAIQAMTAMIEKNADDDLSKVVMAVCMYASDHPDGKFTLDNVLATSMDQEARSVALNVQPLLPMLLKRARAKAGAWFRPA